ncbi:twin-arginine translocase subunit TatC [Basilea psittacipulmonis]|uniref:Sec-independent protein translocase protein TatC n=1 Tax=Basilea psittacipulmonis DSM 24701 TaxID=1072685 RepID=A0A077DJQ5_9BURK|nr:twin-arginine translocase subunit TatC [Basilea psittacipulmonis]AIL33313.1 twin-arginine protein translocation system subunit TatC [Basilea psittacipulmonis DSM 24701]
MSEELKEGSVVSHLIELRSRLLKSIAGILLVLIVLMIYPGAGKIYNWVAMPMMETLPEGHKMIATGVITPFLVPLKVTLLIAFLIALPWVMYQIWAFVAPGLYSHEKKMAAPLVIASSALFYLGMAFCYYVVFGNVFHFIASVAPDSIQFAPDIASYLSFVLTMLFAFGLTFEVPVAVVVLAMTGVASTQKMKEARPYLIVGAFVVAAIVTPPDVMSQLMLAIPLVVLYEIGLIFGRLVEKRETA